jgi:hypothetical protein
MRKHPDVLELREITRRVTGVESFSRLYRASRTARPSIVSREVLFALIVQHLQASGLQTAAKLLQEEAKFTCVY